MAFAYAVMMTMVLTVPALWFAHRAAELHLRTTLAPLAPMLAASLLMGCAVYTIGYLLRTTGDFLAHDTCWQSDHGSPVVHGARLLVHQADSSFSPGEMEVGGLVAHPVLVR